MKFTVLLVVLPFYKMLPMLAFLALGGVRDRFLLAFISYDHCRCILLLN